jgi:hypothetical protein
MVPGSPSLMRDAANQAVGEAVSAQRRVRRCLEGSAQSTSVYLAMWDTFQQAGLQAVRSLQDSAVQATQAVIEAALWATPFAPERRSVPTHLWLDPTLKLSAGGTRFLPGRPNTSAEDDDPDWTESALQFQAPLGSLFADAEDPEDEPRPD